MKKLIAIILTALLAGTAFAACNGGGSESQSPSQAQSEAQSSAASEAASEPQEETLQIEKQDYNGKVFRIYDTWDEENHNSEIMKNTFDGDSNDFMTTNVNEAIEKRNRLTEEYLGITIEEHFVMTSRFGGQAVTDLRENNLSGDLDIHVCAPSIYDCGTLAGEGTFLDLNSIEGFDTTCSWWDQSFNEAATVNGKLFFTQGALGLYGMNATPVVYFNKRMAKELGINDLYSSVKDGTWTFDKAYEYIKMVSEDLNDDGRITYVDKAGWIGQNDDGWNFFYGSGERIVNKSSTGTLYLSMYNDRSVSVITSMNRIFQDETHYVSANDYFGDAATPLDLTSQQFIDGRGLFFSDNMKFVHKFANMDDDFGMLPIPKYSADQEDYYSLINPWSGNAFAIPAVLSEEDQHFAATCLQVFCYFSVDTVQKEYNERTLKFQKTKDEESVEMLDIIFGSRGTDFGFIYNIGSNGNSGNTNSLPWLIHALMDNNTMEFASGYDARKEAAQADLDKIIKLYE